MPGYAQRFVHWRASLLLACSLCLLPAVVLAASWQERKSTHFRVFHRQNVAFAADVIARAEQLYNRIEVDLGLTRVVQRAHAPWLWEDRCKIYLYPDQQTYLRETRAPAWSSGFVKYHQRTIYSFVGAASFLDKTLPHELAHIVFREYVGFDNPRVPRWLDEGVAQYAEVGKSGRMQGALQRMRRWIDRDTYIPLPQLTRMHVGHAQRSTARVFYTQASTLVSFFLDTYGQRRFIDFCSRLRDGHDIERALSFATASSLRSLKALEDEWRAFVLRSP